MYNNIYNWIKKYIHTLHTITSNIKCVPGLLSHELCTGSGIVLEAPLALGVSSDCAITVVVPTNYRILNKNVVIVYMLMNQQNIQDKMKMHLPVNKTV